MTVAVRRHDGARHNRRTVFVSSCVDSGCRVMETQSGWFKYKIFRCDPGHCLVRDPPPFRSFYKLDHLHVFRRQRQEKD